MSKLTEAISYLSDLVEQVLEETISQADFMDLTQQQLHYLRIIVRMHNPTLSELARELGLTKPTVSVLVDRLAEKGYIKRVKSDKDRRCMHLQIDKKGTKISFLSEVAHERLAERIISGLSDSEITVFTDLLQKIDRNID